MKDLSKGVATPKVAPSSNSEFSDTSPLENDLYGLLEVVSSDEVCRGDLCTALDDKAGALKLNLGNKLR